MKEMIPTSDFEDAVHWVGHPPNPANSLLGEEKDSVGVYDADRWRAECDRANYNPHLGNVQTRREISDDRRGLHRHPLLDPVRRHLVWFVPVLFSHSPVLGFVAFDLYSYPRDFLGLTDSWGEGYLQMLRQFAATGKSMNQSRDLHQMHKCCGIFGFDDFFTDRSIGKVITSIS